jgi:hypothetical protein
MMVVDLVLRRPSASSMIFVRSMAHSTPSNVPRRLEADHGLSHAVIVYHCSRS